MLICMVSVHGANIAWARTYEATISEAIEEHAKDDCFTDGVVGRAGVLKAGPKSDEHDSARNHETVSNV